MKMYLLLLFPLLFWRPGSSEAIKGPKEVRGLERGLLTVQCRYDPGWEKHVKYWCRGADWNICKYIVKTNEGQEAKKYRVSIRDDQRNRTLTVTMKELGREDTGTYWCGIERAGADYGAPVKVTIAPDSSEAITGPEEVRGPEWGLLTVQCRYDPGYETYLKWWCRGAYWNSCEILLKTDGSEQEVKESRVSIRDDQRNHMFTVTMKELRREDMDAYWCGIEREGVDLGVPVKVTIAPATTTVSAPTLAITSTTNMLTVPVTPDNTTGFLNVTSHHSDGSGISKNLSILTPLLAVLLMPLLVAASLLAWRMVKRQKKAAEMSPEQALQPPEDQVYYVNLPLEPTGASPRSFGKKAHRQPFSCAQKDQAPFLSKNVAHAALSLDTLDQDSIYVNTSNLIADLPRRSHEELTEYSVITEPHLC